MENLCDPSLESQIPYPIMSDLYRPIDRFVFEEIKGLPCHTTFEFTGRSQLEEIYNLITKADKRKGPIDLAMSGTFGAGKSHLMAACAARLIADKKLVVFLGDANLLRQKNPVLGVRAALLLTFAKNKEIFNSVYEATIEEQLVEICLKASLHGTRLIFFIDELNRLEPETSDGDDVRKDKEACRLFLKKLASSHYRVVCYSDNHLSHEPRRPGNTTYHSISPCFNDVSCNSVYTCRIYKDHGWLRAHCACVTTGRLFLHFICLELARVTRFSLFA